MFGYDQKLEQLKCFRTLVHSSFSSRRDEVFEVIDAISSYGHKVTSVVELSKAPCFSRQYIVNPLKLLPQVSYNVHFPVK